MPLQPPDNATSTTAVAPPPRPASRPARPTGRLLKFALFVACVAWYFCARALAHSAAQGLTVRFDSNDLLSVLDALFTLFLVTLGLGLLRVIERDAGRGQTPLRQALGLPRRTTARPEWATGAALGWGLSAAAVLPMALARTLNVHLWTTSRAFFLLALSLVTLAAGTLAKDGGVHGYAFQRLVDAIGPTRATLFMALITAIYIAFNPAASSAAVVVSVLLSVLLSLAWLRTHALWLLWGLHFASAVSTAVLFGLPLGGDTSFSTVIETRASGPLWLTGGSYGPAAALFSIPIVLGGIILLVRLTSDYAWDYTRPPIVAAGYDVTIPPPSAHIAMEQAAPSSTLVQILPATSQISSDQPRSE